MDRFNDMQAVKRRFFAMRNGVIADTMRKAGSPFKIIFGLVLPQIREIADEIGYSPELAERLWENRSTRESMLIAPMLIDPLTISAGDAEKLAAEAPSTEVADLLVHSLLRKLPYSFELALKLAESSDRLLRYCSMRLLWHHLMQHSEEILKIAKEESNRKDPLTLQPARQIIEEIEFLSK